MQCCHYSLTCASSRCKNSKSRAHGQNIWHYGYLWYSNVSDKIDVKLFDIYDNVLNLVITYLRCDKHCTPGKQPRTINKINELKLNIERT